MFFWKKKVPPDTRLIVGLGNPGEHYARNRHNVGFMCIADFARRHGIRLDRKQGQARTGEGEASGCHVVLARPQTFMNRSGQAVANLMRRYRVTRERLIVIYDELDLPLGKLRIRQGGSSAGHKGIVSIINAVGGHDFTRIRVGIGRPDITEDKDVEVIGHVLGNMTAEEEQTLNDSIGRVSQSLDCLLTEGIAVAMNKFN